MAQKKKTLGAILLGMLLMSSLTGCDEAPATSTTPSTSSASLPPAPPTDEEVANGTTFSEEPVDEYTESEDEDVERQVAEVGVGKRGRNYGGGVISEPIRAYFRTKQRINLLNMDHAMQLYKAEHGNLPKTHESFMKEIIEANGIQLPELPDGERYVYDPEQGQLMVERPKG